jgi:lipopolysaccharide export system protein LptC
MNFLMNFRMNFRMNPVAALLLKLRVPALLLVSIALILFVLERSGNDEVGTATAAASALARDYDYYINDMSTTRFTATGQTAWHLQASRVTHYPDGDIAVMEAPRFSYQDEAAAPWQATADTAMLFADTERGEDRIELQGQVLLRQAPADDNFLEVRTALLTLFPDSHEARTDAAVELLSPDSRITGTGLQAWLDRKHVKLLNAVRGTYDQPARLQ